MDREQINKRIIEALKKQQKQWAKALSGRERELLKVYKTALDAVRSEISQMYQKYGETVSFSEMAKYRRLDNLEKNVQESLIKIHSQIDSDINALLKETFKTNYYETGGALFDATTIEITLPKISSDIILKAIENPFDRVKWQSRLKGHHQKAVQQVKQEITQGLIRGRGYSKTAREITNKVNSLSNNMLRIVRTETHRVQSEARLESFDKAEKSFRRLGYKMVKVISSVDDDRTREQSRIVDGQEADEKGLFLYPDGNKYRGPGLTGVPEWDINDREVVVVKVL